VTLRETFPESSRIHIGTVLRKVFKTSWYFGTIRMFRASLRTGLQRGGTSFKPQTTHRSNYITLHMVTSCPWKKFWVKPLPAHDSSLLNNLWLINHQSFYHLILFWGPLLVHRYTSRNKTVPSKDLLIFWRRNYSLILAHPVYKMWIIQEPNTLELWNKLHFEEKKKESIYIV